jgi:cytochrome c-type biogenesis protein CcmH/NrfG
LKPTLPDPQWRLALDRLIAGLRERVQAEPDDHDNWVALAMALEAAWQDYEAMWCYAQALELKPNDQRILRLMDGLRCEPEPKRMLRDHPGMRAS